MENVPDRLHRLGLLTAEQHATALRYGELEKPKRRQRIADLPADQRRALEGAIAYNQLPRYAVVGGPTR